MITTNGNTDLNINTPNREYAVWLAGNFNGATIAVQCSKDGVNFAPPTDDGSALQFTSGGGRIVCLPGKHLRFVCSGAGGSTSISASAEPLL